MKAIQIKMDKARNLKFGMNGLIDLEEALGRSIMDMGDNIKISDLRTILWIGLKWEDKELTPEKTGDLMDIVIENESLEYLAEKVQKAFESFTKGSENIPVKKK